MSARKKRDVSENSYISRSVSDANFAHCLEMFAYGRVMIKNAKTGTRIDQSSLNCLIITAEVLEALIRHLADGGDPLAASCQDALAKIREVDAVMSGKP